METISWQDFEQVDARVGTIVTAEVFAEARRPAYILQVDFGPDIQTPRLLLGESILGWRNGIIFIFLMVADNLVVR